MAIEYDYSKLRGRIIEKFGSQSAFAKALGISFVTVSNKMNQKSGFGPEDIEAWSKLLDIDFRDYGIFYFSRKV